MALYPPTDCHECKRVHPGPRCRQRSRQFSITVPDWLFTLMRDTVPEGGRSQWLSELIADELGFYELDMTEMRDD